MPHDDEAAPPAPEPPQGEPPPREAGCGCLLLVFVAVGVPFAAFRMWWGRAG